MAIKRKAWEQTGEQNMHDLERIARNLVFRYCGDRRFFLIIDSSYEALGRVVEQVYPCTRSFCLTDRSSSDFLAFVKSSDEAEIMMLAEPRTYLDRGLYKLMDFTHGEPELLGCNSHVLIFPHESLYRIFSADPEEDYRARSVLLGELKPNSGYTITSAAGTELEFVSRCWIPLEFEICTAPIESSLNGRIVVDGAVFFRKNDLAVSERIVLEIVRGELRSIVAYDDAGERLRSEYAEMILPAVNESINRQLAEIGIGFCRGATVSDCFMEAEASADTCHFCFGNNICYGGNNLSDFHGNSVLIRNPLFSLKG